MLRNFTILLAGNENTDLKEGNGQNNIQNCKVFYNKFIDLPNEYNSKKQSLFESMLVYCNT